MTSNRVFAIVLALLASGAEAATWYVRTDGGSYGTTSTTCNGQTDAAYTGGNGPNCAVNHPFEVLGTYAGTPRVQRIAGGDTVIIKNGSYRMGYTAGTYDTGSCYSAWTYDCIPAALPSGPNASTKTKIYGEGYASCTTKPELWMTHGASWALSLESTSNADIRCLDITDHDDCGGNSGNSCSGSNPWGRRGIVGWSGSNNNMQDVLVHGLAYTGVMMGKQTDFTATNLDVYGNGLSGFDQDHPSHSGDNSWAGTSTFSGLSLSWNGCAENYPVDGGYNNCTDQNDSGYGDGWGSPSGGTAGSFTFTDSEFLNNTSDALDLLYLNDVNSLVTVDRVKFEGNVGNLIKIGNGKGIVRNSQIIANCGVWDGRSYKGANFSTCRAGGNAIVFDLGGGGLADVVNNTIVGEADILIEVFGCDGGEALNVKNNVLVGTTQYGGGDTTSWKYEYSGCTGSEFVGSNNVIYGVKESTPCSGQSDCSTSNPNVVSANFTTDVFDLRLQSGSPAIDLGLNSGTTVGQTTIPTVDFNGDARPATDVDAGALEFSAGGPPTIITTSLPNGQVGVAYSQQITVTGGTTPYTACDETSGALPAGSPAFTSTANGSGCLIAGTPTGVEVASFTERVTDNAAQTDSQALSITIIAANPTITTTTMPDGVVGFAYSHQILYSGGQTPVSWSTVAGSHCGGLSLGASTGIISGTPTTAETCNFTVRVTDANTNTDDQALSITIGASVGTIVSAANPGSSGVVIRFGFVGLPYSADCNAVVYQSGSPVGSDLTTEGPARRTSVITGLTPSTAYTATMSCDVPSGEDNISFSTFAASTGAQTVPLQFGAPPAILVGAARLTVEYDDNEALSSPATSQNTSCGSGCTVNLSLSAGLYYYRHKWQTAADVVLATSAVQALQVQ